ncbi:hypothetical protein HK096_004315 [Nowakowskiella sp. JEL0078]|nr:hypothetical protein HK096_004315 [Nowakowskiella sp. JEL0078]
MPEIASLPQAVVDSVSLHLERYLDLAIELENCPSETALKSSTEQHVSLLISLRAKVKGQDLFVNTINDEMFYLFIPAYFNSSHKITSDQETSAHLAGLRKQLTIESESLHKYQKLVDEAQVSMEEIRDKTKKRKRILSSIWSLLDTMFQFVPDSSRLEEDIVREKAAREADQCVNKVQSQLAGLELLSKNVDATVKSIESACGSLESLGEKIFMELVPDAVTHSIDLSTKVEDAILEYVQYIQQTKLTLDKVLQSIPVLHQLLSDQQVSKELLVISDMLSVMDHKRWLRITAKINEKKHSIRPDHVAKSLSILQLDHANIVRPSIMLTSIRKNYRHLYVSRQREFLTARTRLYDFRLQIIQKVLELSQFNTINSKKLGGQSTQFLRQNLAGSPTNKSPPKLPRSLQSKSIDTFEFQVNKKNIIAVQHFSPLLNNHYQDTELYAFTNSNSDEDELPGLSNQKFEILPYHHGPSTANRHRLRRPPAGEFSPQRDYLFGRSLDSFEFDNDLTKSTELPFLESVFLNNDSLSEGFDVDEIHDEIHEQLHELAHIDYSKQIFHNPSVPVLYEEALKNEFGTAISSSGALTALSGAKKG